MAWTGNNISTGEQPNPKQFASAQSDVKVDYNRAYATRRDTDDFSDISITLEDIDGTIMHHIENNLVLQVMDNGETIKVPIIYGDPERWVAMRKGAGIRDNQGKLQLPAIMVSRTNVENNKDLALFNKYLNYQVETGYTEKNKYDRFDLLVGNKPTRQILNVTMPKHVICTYECIIWTDYVIQNNTIIEQLNFDSKDYWGDKDRYKFRTHIDSFATDTEIDDDGDRNVKTTFTLTVYAYLLDSSMTSTMEGRKSTLQKLFTVRKIVTDEHVVNARTMGYANNSIANSIPGKDKVVSDYELSNGTVSKIEKTGEKTIIPTSTGTVTIYKTRFHPAPATLGEYGENGWLAYDDESIYVYKYPSGWVKADIETFDYDPDTGTYISGYDCDGDPIYTTGDRRPINTAFRIFRRFPDKFYQQVPVQSTDYGEDGWISYDGDYLYIYSGGSWRRIAIS
jgi:hypothetical protein